MYKSYVFKLLNDVTNKIECAIKKLLSACLFLSPSDNQSIKAFTCEQQKMFHQSHAKPNASLCKQTDQFFCFLLLFNCL